MRDEQNADRRGAGVDEPISDVRFETEFSAVEPFESLDAFEPTSFDAFDSAAPVEPIEPVEPVEPVEPEPVDATIDKTFSVDKPRIARAVREILAAIGENPDREGLVETPWRVARMYAEMFEGLNQDPAKYLRKFFAEKYDSMVIVRDIEFHSMCEHHLLPFVGRAHIGYIPKGRVVGLSKLARVVEAVAKRPQLQERLTETIANLLMSELGAIGVGVVVEATHACMTIRGVRKPGSLCVTSAMKGSFRSDDKTRAEFLKLALRK